MTDARPVPELNASAARFWLFAVAALILGPILSYAFGWIFRTPILFGFPFVAAGLLAVSFPFGLWRRANGLLVKIGTALWIVILSWGSPVIMVVTVCFAGLFMHLGDSCFA